MRSFMREKKIYCGKHYREVDIYPYTAAQLTASTRGKRSKKIKETEPKQKNLNDKNARRYFTQTANLNFGSDPEALHVTATYSGKYLPDTVEQAEQEATNFLRRVQYRRKKEGLPPLKYMYEFYKAALEEEMERFYSAFLMKNDIFPPASKKAEEIPAAEISRSEAFKLQALMAGMGDHTRRPVLGSGVEP